MQTLKVSLGKRSYPIYIGHWLENPSVLVATLKNSEVLVVTNETVAPLYLDQVVQPLVAAGKSVDTIVLPDGEQYKTLETINLIYSKLLERPFSRKVALVALGGGVVGDMTGFAAATYQRGVDFVQIPTTLLSQVDSSVGGKTGVNHVLGKNMIGAFKQPKAVFIDPQVLKTLPERELSAGFAEVIKHALLKDKDYLGYLEANVEHVFALNENVLAEIIRWSCRIKADVVAADETEQGVRATLNLGHTFGHAIETTMGYGNWLHGEAVGMGLLMAATMSKHLGWLSEADVDRVRALLIKSHLPVDLSGSMTVEQFMTAMRRDKKVDAGQIVFILFKALGHAIIVKQYDQQALEQTLFDFC